MNVYRPKYKDGNGKTKLCSKYRIDFIDRKEIRRRLPAFAQKKESEKAVEMIQWLMSNTSRTLDPELQRWLDRYRRP